LPSDAVEAHGLVCYPGRVGDESGAPLGWVAAQRWRLRVLRRDGPRLLGAALQSLRWALRPPPPRPSLALVEGRPIARRDAPNTYRIRLCNPTDEPRSVELVVRGWRGSATRPCFEARNTIDLAPGTCVERSLRTSWHGDASFSAPDSPSLTIARPPLTAAAPEAERWTLEASLEDGERVVERLRIGGCFTAPAGQPAGSTVT